MSPRSEARSALAVAGRFAPWRRRGSIAALLALLALPLAGMIGCSSSSSSSTGSTSSASDTDAQAIGCGGDKRAETYAAGMGQMGTTGTFHFILMNANPAPETTGTEVWTLKLTDASGAAVTDATFPVMKPWMPEHGHGTATVEITNNKDGTYTLNPMYLFMLGLWEVDMTASAGGKTDSTSFFFCLQ